MYVTYLYTTLAPRYLLRKKMQGKGRADFKNHGACQCQQTEPIHADLSAEAYGRPGRRSRFAYAYGFSEALRATVSRPTDMKPERPVMSIGVGTRTRVFEATTIGER